MFNQNLDAMIRRLSDTSDNQHNAAALDILHKVKSRAYADIRAFRRDFDAYLSLLDAHYADLSRREPIRQAWADALHLLTADHWRKFRFHPADISAYV